MRTFTTSTILLALLSLGQCQDLYRRSECSHDSQVTPGTLSESFIEPDFSENK